MVIETLRDAWEAASADLLRTPFFTRLREGTLDVRHYQALLREIYYNTRQNPPSFALMVMHLQGGRRSIARKVYRHCAAEDGHHDMALEDLKALGADVSGIPGGRPLATTEALTAFSVYHVQHGNPLAYLGYVYHLEMLPAVHGHDIIRQLSAIGIPKQAMSFLIEHAHADEGHSRWMSEYVRDAVEDEEDLDAVLHGLTGACKLHGVMLTGIVESVPGTGDWSLVPGRPATTSSTRLAKERAASLRA